MTSELVVLVDARGRPIGTADKAAVHGPDTPRHLAFSCYAFDRSGRLLVTQRALTKRTWPGVWTNSCCGHPAPGESVDDAVRRRLSYELGLVPAALLEVLPDFSYRAELDGVVENELCPVFLARVDGEPTPNPAEVAAWVWTSFDAFAARGDISPWAREQVALLRPHLPRLLDGESDDAAE